MKKTICARAALMFCGLVNAREHKLLSKNIEYESRNEISISYGALSTSHYLNGLSEMVNYPLLTDYSYGEDNYFGPISLEYICRVNRWLGVGGIAVYTRNKQAMIQRDHHQVGTAYDNYFTVLPTAKFDWLRRHFFGMYSKLGLGVTMRAERHKADGLKSQSDFNSFFNFQFTLIGLEGGSSHLRGFVELGMGEQGTALAGLRYKF